MKLSLSSLFGRKARARRSTFFASAGYEAVQSPYDEMRRRAVVETTGEDGQLPANRRLKLVNLQRDMMRNSPMRAAQDRQLRVNIVGSVGGKMYAGFPAEFKAAADEVMAYFNKVWFPRAEFTFRDSFNQVLKTIVTSLDVGGDMVLVFDDGILTGGRGTGRIRAFEADEIADVRRLEDFFPAGYTQRQGFVYNKLGMFCGAFVSTSQRGCETFDPAKGIIRLELDPFSDDTPNWIMLGSRTRFNQGRGVSPLTGALTTMIDQHETSANEALASKWNSQLVGQVLHDAGTGGGAGNLPGAFDDETGGGGGTDVKKVVLDRLKAIGIRYQDMPEGLKMELFDTKRPNQNLAEYLDFLSGLVGGSRGLTRVFATMKAQTSYTAFRGEQVMAEQTFKDDRKTLERTVCDWAVKCVVKRALAMGQLRAPLPPAWETMIAWQWPHMIEVSEKDAAEALNRRLKNGTTSLKREVGPGERERIIAEMAEEKALFEAAGLIYPAAESVSGAVAETGDGETDTQQTEDNE